MAGKCLVKLPHSCGTADALQVFEREDDGTVDGYCYACNTYVRHPFGERVAVEDVERPKLAKTDEEIEEELREIAECQAHDLPDRGLRKAALEHYGIKVGMSYKDGKTPALVYFPYRENGKVVAYKVRLLEQKRSWWVGEAANVDLFGWQEAIESGAKRLVIVEGEFDVPATMTILKRETKKQWEDNIPAIVSIPHGAGTAHTVLQKKLKDIRKYFKDVSFMFDQDVAGQKATDECCKVMPEAKVINLPKKDANDCLLDGATKAAHSAITFNAAKQKNSRIVWGDEVHDAARQPPVWGYSWPWEHLNKATRGIRLGETIYIGAGVKMGKSEVVNALAAHFITEHGWKVFLAKPEEANNKTYKLLASKIAGKIFHDPEIEFDFEAYDKAGEKLAGKVALVNLYQHLGWQSLQDDIRAAAADGCKAIFIDPITNLTNGMNAADANTKLQEIAQSLAAMALDLNIVIFIFCHLKAPENGSDHEHGGKVLSSQFAGSRAMMRSCNLMIGIEGNKSSDLSREEKNMRHMILLEDREFGNTGKFGLYWDYHTGLFNEV
jgi:twinkle protein